MGPDDARSLILVTGCVKTNYKVQSPRCKVRCPMSKGQVQCRMSNVQCLCREARLPASMMSNLEVPLTSATQTLDFGHWTLDFPLDIGHWTLDFPLDFGLLAFCSADAQCQDHVIAYQVVGRAGVVDTEVLPVNGKGAVNCDGIRRHCNLRREGDRLRDTMHC